MAEKTRDELLVEAEKKMQAGDNRPASQIVAEDLAARADGDQQREQVGVPRDKSEGSRDVEGNPNP